MHISKYVVIEQGVVSVQGQEVFRSDEGDFSVFAKEIYQHLNMAYPKFFKMDSLSKLALLGVEFLLNKDDQAQDIAVVLANKSSSLDTDIKHQQSIADKSAYYPSPAIFVYTLANICLGEISIKHQLRSENAFFVAASFPVDLMLANANYLLQSNKASKVLCGWVEYYQESYKLVCYLVENQGTTAHNKIEIQKIIK